MAREKPANPAAAIPARRPQVVPQVDPAPVRRRALGDQAAQGQQAQPGQPRRARTAAHSGLSHGAGPATAPPARAPPGRAGAPASPLSGQPASRRRSRAVSPGTPRRRPGPRSCGCPAGLASRQASHPPKQRSGQAPGAEGRVERGHQRAPVRLLPPGHPGRSAPRSACLPRRRRPAPPSAPGRRAGGPQEQRQDHHGGPRGRISRALPNWSASRPASGITATRPAGPTSRRGTEPPVGQVQPRLDAGIRRSTCPRSGRGGRSTPAPPPSCCATRQATHPGPGSARAGLAAAWSYGGVSRGVELCRIEGGLISRTIPAKPGS